MILLSLQPIVCDSFNVALQLKDNQPRVENTNHY